MPKKIYLIRHGQTGHNHRGIVQGRYVNSKLSRKGHIQAEAFFNAYKDIPFQKVYTSTLRRTIQTVQKFIDKGIPHKQLPGLDEVCWGDSEGLFAKGNNNKRYYEVINSWKNGELHKRLNGGENPYEVQKRQEEALNYIISQPDDLVLVCMHGRALKILLAWITGLSITEMDLFNHDNLSLYIINYTEGKYVIETNDDRKHLQNLT